MLFPWVCVTNTSSYTDTDPNPHTLDNMSDQQPQLEISASRQFTAWLLEQNLSLAFSTYQAGKLFFVGLQPNGRLSVFERTFERCMGLYAEGNTLYTSTLYQLWRFENALEPGQFSNEFDALFVPQVGYVTGDLDIHDIAYAQASEAAQFPPGLVFVNTLFSCLATTSESHSFKPLWQPNHISKLAAEDRCHLNGLAMKDGQPKYVTAVSQSDVNEGWRDRRVGGGCIIDVETQAVVATGLSMPHSPRWYQGKLWVLNSGEGELGTINLDTGTFEAIAFCPGYLRGLTFAGDFAIVGLSKSRGNKTFAELPLEAKLQEKQAEPRCGLMVIDLKTGDIVHNLRIDGIVEELYDVVVLPGIRRPMAIGFKTDEVRRLLTLEE
jgi:uncharacterized protein (TIGR03032 family)